MKVIFSIYFLISKYFTPAGGCAIAMYQVIATRYRNTKLVPFLVDPFFDWFIPPCSDSSWIVS
jgi:hypothetical protein